MFKGFSKDETFTPIPDSFLRDLIHQIEDINELKVTLYALWRVEHLEARVRFLRERDFQTDEGFMNGITLKGLRSGLRKAVQRGTLLSVASNAERDTGLLYFVNSPRGRAAVESIKKGKWAPGDETPAPVKEQANIFKLYEENLGALTPLIADALKDAEKDYPGEWIAEAIEIAVKSNKRNWRYVEAILKRWKEEGHAKKQGSRNAKEDRRKYTEGKFADFVEH
jgi:DnaD/phage-associated family protein